MAVHLTLNLKKLQTLQNDAIRAITGKRRDESVRDFLSYNKLLNVKYTYLYELGVQAYKNFNSLLSPDSIFHFPLNQNRLRHSEVLTLPLTLP